MIIIKDSMVLIHLAKITLLETSCEHFKKVAIPKKIKDETTNTLHSDAKVIKDLIAKGKIEVIKVKDTSLIKKANEFNIQGGEAEAVALYWEINANLLATDDDNVRRKREVLQLNMIGTPALMLELYKKNKINKAKLYDSIKTMKIIGWFSNTVWDKILMEVDKNG